MKFEVRAVLRHPDKPPGAVDEIELSGDGDLQAANDLLMHAVEEVQRAAGLPSAQAELLTSRGMFGVIEAMLDGLGVGHGSNEGMLGLTQRLGLLGNEVRRLRSASGIPDVARAELERRIAEFARQRDEAYGSARAYGRVINEVRRALALAPGVPDAEVASEVGRLAASSERTQRSLQGCVNTIREVRVALNVGPETFDHQLAGIVRAFRVGNVEAPADRELADVKAKLQAVLTALELPWILLMDAKATVDMVRDSVRDVAQRADRVGETEAKLNEHLLELENLGRLVSGFDGFAEPSTYDALRERVRLPLEKLQAVLTCMGLPPGYWGAVAALDELRVKVEQVADNSDRWLALTPERFAQAAYGGQAGTALFQFEPWSQVDPVSRARFIKAAGHALAELSGGEVEQVVPSPTPDQLARLIHDGRTSPPGVTRVPWEQLSLEFREVELKAAEYALDQLEGAPRYEAASDAETLVFDGKPQATPRHLAHVMFLAAQEVSARRGSEPIPLTASALWEEASWGRKSWWFEVAERVLETLWVVPSTTLLPVVPEELGRAMYEDGPHAAPWTDVRTDYVKHAARVLDRLPSLAAPKTFSGVSLRQLAQALHESRVASMKEGHRVVWLPLPWTELGEDTRQYMESVAEKLRQRLPEMVRSEQESESSFVAHMDAVTAELRQRIAVLQRENRQLVEAGNDANNDMHSYRGMVMFVADQLGIPADRVDDATLFGDAFREAIEWHSKKVDELGVALLAMRGMPGYAPEGQFIAADAATAIGYLRKRLEVSEARPVVTVCAPDPADWQVLLTPVGGSRPDGCFRSGDTLDLVDAGEFTATLKYVGSDPQRPPDGLLLPSVSAEELGRAWFDADNSLGISWEQMPVDVREAYGFHAKRVIELLTPQSIVDAVTRDRLREAGRALRKTGLAMRPGEFFTADGEKARSFLWNADRLSGFDGVKIDDMSGKSFRTSSLSQESVLAQLREQGELLRELNDKLARKDQVIADVAAAMGFTETSGAIEQIIISQAREIEAFRRGHRACLGAEGLERELTEQLGVALGRDSRDEPWPELLERAKLYAMRVARFTEMRKILGFSPDTHPDMVVRAVKELKASWDSSEAQFDQLFEAFEITQDTSTDDNVASAVDRMLAKVAEWKGLLADPDEVKRLFAPVLEVGRAHGLSYADGDSKVVFADQVLMRARNAIALNSDARWLAIADQVAHRLERFAEKQGPTSTSQFAAITGEQGEFLKHRWTLKFAAGVVREHAAALVSGEHPAGLVMALQSNTFWAPGVGLSELELVPDADGDVVFRDDTQSADGKALGLLVLPADEVAPVGAALLMLAAYNTRVAGLSTKIAEKLPEVEKAAAIVKTPTAPQTWTQGPTAYDADPGKRWHVGCGGEVLTFEGVDICQDCNHRFEDGV